MKFLAIFALALIAVASADVSHLRQYLPPVEGGSAGIQAAPAAAPSNQYLPPAAAPAPAPAPAELPVFSAPAEPAAASFNEADGYNYQHP